MSIGRQPRDLVRLLVASGLLAASVLLALVPANPVEIAIFQQLERIPAASDPLWIALSWCGSWAGIAAVTAIALYLKRIRLGVLCATAGGVTWALAKGMHWLLGPRPIPARVLSESTNEVFFPATSVAVVAVLTVVCAPYLGSRTRLVGWVLTVLVATADIHLGYHLPWGVVAGALLGWGVGTLFHLLWGAPGHKISEEIVRRELELSGFGSVSVVALEYRLLEPRQFAVHTEAGETFRVNVVRRLQRRAGPLYRASRSLAVLEVPGEPRLSSAHHEVEHEAYVTLLAERAGVRTPAIVLACDVKHAPPLLVHRQVDGRRLTQLTRDELDDELLEAIWEQIATLTEAGIAHHDLRAKNILVDSERRPWLLSFTFGQAGAGAARRAQDLAEVLDRKSVV